MRIYIFLQLFGMVCKLPVALNADMRFVAFQLFNHHYFISYFIVSKWWPISQWNKSYFFPLVNFGSGWTARVMLLLSGLDMTLFTALHTSDVLHHVS